MFLWYILLLVSGPCLVVVFSSPRWPSAIALILKQQKILLLQQIRQCFQGKNVFGLKTCLDYCEDPARSCKIWIFPFLPKQNRFIKKEARVASLNLFERLLDLSQQHVRNWKLSQVQILKIKFGLFERHIKICAIFLIDMGPHLVYKTLLVLPRTSKVSSFWGVPKQCVRNL